MGKIIDKEFRDRLRVSLKEAGMTDAAISNLITEQYHQAVKELVITRLEIIVNLLKNGDYERIKSILVQSPPESDTESSIPTIQYIGFADLIPYCEDFGDVISTLKHNLF